MDNLCPCGTPLPYLSCCGLYIENNESPKTPEQLMRSRYTAFTKGNADYLEKTMQGEPLKNFNASQTSAWAQRVRWDKLEVISASFADESTQKGFVQFVAHYFENDKPDQIKELSEFKKIEGRWYYTGTAKMGRNDPCFCGSGKKYKKCCATNP